MEVVSDNCIDLAPTLSSVHKPAGRYSIINNINTYIVGPANATKAVLFFYDGLSWKQQTLTGADLLASLMPDTLIVMPDLVKGEKLPQSIRDMPPTEQSDATTEWLNRVSNPDVFKAESESLMDSAKREPELDKIKKWACFGLCRGAKVTFLMAGHESRFVVAGVGHPAGANADLVNRLTIPLACLFSREDVDPEQRGAIEGAFRDLEQETYFETFNRPHGWMGGRCNFAVDMDREEFERGYKTVAAFLLKHLA